MRKKGWIKGAHLNERWLKGKNIAMQADDKGKWATSNPKLDYYNPKLFNHEWLSQFDRYNEAVENLKKGFITSKSKSIIVKYLKRNNAFNENNFKDVIYYENSSTYRTLTSSHALKAYHNLWQVQNVSIDVDVLNKLNTYINNDWQIDDLWSAFGAFALYGAIGDYRIIPRGNWYTIYIKSIICYVVDSYDFIAMPDDYLGHWNRTDFDFFILNKEEVKNHNISYNPRREDTRGSFNPNDLLYPVFNHHYQAYRKKLTKGKIWSSGQKHI